MELQTPTKIDQLNADRALSPLDREGFERTVRWLEARLKDRSFLTSMLTRPGDDAGRLVSAELQRNGFGYTRAMHLATSQLIQIALIQLRGSIVPKLIGSPDRA